MKQSFLWLMTIALLLSFGGCTKDGTVGPQGPEGAEGPVGPQGPQGTKGAAGTANVFYSGWSRYSFSTGGGATNYFLKSIGVNRITQEVVDKGAVMVFVKGYNSSSNIMPLPYVLTNTADKSLVYLIQSSFMVNSILIESFGIPKSYLESNIYFRYIVIPGGQTARRIGVDINNYEELCTYYDIPL